MIFSVCLVMTIFPEKTHVDKPDIVMSHGEEVCGSEQ